MEVVEFRIETREVIPVIVQETRLLGLEQARLDEVFDAFLEHEGVRLHAVVAAPIQEVDHPPPAAQGPATDVQQLVPGVETMTDQGLELGPPGFLEALDSTADLGGHLIQPFPSTLQGLGRVRGRQIGG